MIGVERLLKNNAKRGFLAMLGSIDCMHWQWKNCPEALAGQSKGKEKKPTIVLEAWADQELWIWHCNFGSPGSLNDINIIDKSPEFQKILKVEAPAIKFTVNGSIHISSLKYGQTTENAKIGNEYDMGYLLADGIYPDWPVFIKSVERPQGLKHKHFSKCQEACRKGVERAFGVLQAR